MSHFDMQRRPETALSAMASERQPAPFCRISCVPPRSHRSWRIADSGGDAYAPIHVLNTSEALVICLILARSLGNNISQASIVDDLMLCNMIW